MAVQHLGPYLAWITLVVVLFTCSHVPDGRTQGDVAPQNPGEREAPSPTPPAPAEEAPSPPPVPSTGVLFGKVTTILPPTADPGQEGSPGPIPGGSPVPVAVARVGIAPVGSSHIWWVVTSVDGSFAIRVPAGIYRVTLDAHPRMGVARDLPATVTVEAGQQTRFDIHLNTGIP